MSTEAYRADVTGLAQALMELDVAERVAFETPDAAPFDGVDIVVHVDNQDARAAIAVQQLLQLSLDAAALAVVTLDPERFRAEEWERQDDIGRVELTIVDLGNGSFFARFSVNPGSKAGRNRLLAILSFAALGAALLFPPSALVTGPIIAALAALNAILTPDDVPQGRRYEPATVDADDIPDSTSVLLAIEKSNSFTLVIDGATENVVHFVQELRRLPWVGDQAWLVSSGGQQPTGAGQVRVRPLSVPLVRDVRDVADLTGVRVVDPPL